MTGSERFEASFPTRHWHKLSDGRVQCDVCPRFCKLHPGQRGLCFVRGNEDDAIVLTTWGRSSGFCVDPIEKKPLNHFLPGTPILSFGTAGCNLACKFCQNWDISKSREWDTLADAATPETIARAAQQLGCRSVAYTYNDPAIFPEYAIDVATACRELGIRSVAVTAGYMTPAPRAELFGHMDAANVDLKCFTEDFYHKLCGAHLASILETLVYLRHETTVWLELTTLLIPDLNDSDREIEEMTQWVVENLGPDVPWHFSGWWKTSARTCRGTSRPFIRSGRCAISRPPRSARCCARTRSRAATACATPTRGTCTTKRTAPPTATPATRA